MERILVLGRGGAGKSTLARRLGELTGFPLTELDQWFWQPGLIATPRDRWVDIQHEFIQAERWIIDADLGPDRGLRLSSRGGHLRCLKHLLSQYDAVLYLSPAGRQALTGRAFFPHLISAPFHDGPVVVFATAAGLSAVAAVASLMRGTTPTTTQGARA